MKRLKLILVILLATPIILLVGCSEATHEQKDTGVYIDQTGIPVTVVVIEGCEYLIYDGLKQFGMTHKGNCKYHEDEKDY